MVTIVDKKDSEKRENKQYYVAVVTNSKIAEIEVGE